MRVPSYWVLAKRSMLNVALSGTSFHGKLSKRTFKMISKRGRKEG